MKKLLFSTAIIGLLFSTSCKKDDDGGGITSCENRVTEIENSLQALTNNPTVANCERYVNALKSYLNSSCTGGSDATYQAILDDIDCSEML